MPEGRWLLILHSHLPYVLGHGRWPHGESWIFEAAVETYLPLLEACERLVEEGIRPGFTVEISPVLGEQLDDPRFTEGFPRYLETLVEAARLDEERFGEEGEPQLAALADRWQRHHQEMGDRFAARGGSLLDGFAALDREDAIELATCARTHGLLPLLGSAARVRTQVEEGTAWFRERFGRPSRGLWMPECAYRPDGPWGPAAPGPEAEGHRPGNEHFLEEAGVEWTVVDTHLVAGGEPLGSYPAKGGGPAEEGSPYRAYPIGRSTVRALPRDPASTLQVWSGEWGYPGNPWYLDFHKKHSQGGLRYWRVTERASDLGDKRLYEPERVPEVIAEQAHHFGEVLSGVIEQARSEGVEEPLVVSPYDTELFGHWWAEGVEWLTEARRELERRGLAVSTVSEALAEVPPGPPRDLPAGSWGDGGDFRVWDDEETQGAWHAVYRTEDLLAKVEARLPAQPEEDLRRVVRQLRRSTLLVEASDWPFLISTGGAPDYAAARLRGHAEDATRLAAMAGDLLSGHPLEEEQRELLERLSARDALWCP